MSERCARNLNLAATAAFSLLLVAAAIFGAVQVHRFLIEEAANWPLSYEGTPEATAQVAAHSARAKRALALFAADGTVGWAGVCASAALKRIPGLSWAAAAIALVFLVLADLCTAA